MSRFQLKGRWAVVTGASSGIGRALAECLAEGGCNLILVARRKPRLEELAATLKKVNAVLVRTIELDLSQKDAANILMAELADTPVSIMVNNAGFAQTGLLEQISWQKISDMIDLNVRFLTHFTYLMLPGLLRQAKGARILNVGSIAGFQGVCNMQAYAATKAYVNNFSQGLQWELESTSVRVTCLAPGKTVTEFFDVANMTDSNFLKGNLMSAKEVAQIGVNAMIKGKTTVIPGFANWFSVFAHRFSTPWMVKKVIQNLFKDLGQRA